MRIVTGAKTQKILFAEAGAGAVKATGVEALVDGKVETFTPKKEVVLAAGAFNTPKVRVSHKFAHLVWDIYGYLDAASNFYETSDVPKTFQPH